MNVFRAGFLTLASLALLLAGPAPAQADVRSLHPTQTLPKPTNPSYQHFGVGLGVDGPHIIVLAMNENAAGNTHAALLYRRNSNGAWVYRRTLATATGFLVRNEVRMKNGIAAVQFGGQVSLFEYAGGDYVPARVAAPIRHPGGVAISGNSVLIGGDGCDYDAVVYQKGTDNTWRITGRLDDNTGSECDVWGTEVALNYDYALVRPHYGEVTAAWRRNGAALDWVPAGVLSLPPDLGHSESPYTLQGATAVGNNGYVFRRSGSSTWSPQGKATSVDHDNSFGVTFDAVYRDGVLVTSESWYWPILRAYLETSPGQFDHVASLQTSDNASLHDISGRTVVAVAREAITSRWDVEVFTLPTPLRAPQPVVNDFEDRNVSDLTFNSGQFALATRGTDDVLAQNSSSTLAIALVTDTDWTDYQRIEADITPTFGAGDSWAGLVARYVDANNYYFAVIRANNAYGIYKRVNGVNTLLGEGNFNATSRFALVVDGNNIFLRTGDGDGLQSFPGGTDNSLTHGRAGLVTWQARADFDDVHAAGTDEYLLFLREYGFGGNDNESGLDELSGDWQVIEVSDSEESYLDGLAQRDTSGNAVAIIGTPVANQEIGARMRVDAFAASQQGAWFGLLARYVDARNHYYVTVRSTGQVQIRKIVNGVITVLGTANFSAVPGRYYDVRFLVINDQLQLYVDGTLVASAHDRAIASGKYGLATYRAAARWATFRVLQP